MRARTTADPSVLAEKAGEPRLHRVLGAYFHLEPLHPDDEERLEHAAQRLASVLGPELRWTAVSVVPGVAPYRPDDLDYIPGSVAALPQPQLAGATVEEEFVAADLVRLTRNDFQLRIKGGDDPAVVSPVSISYWNEIPFIVPGDPTFTIYPVLAFTVPEDRPLSVLASLVVEAAAALRLRWANFGLTYASWELYDITTAPKARYAHARRHPGFDVGEYVRCVDIFHGAIRSVSWLTLLGPSLAAELSAAQREALARSSLLRTFSAGPNLVVQAGAQPEAGNWNRLIFPPAYVEADRILRPQRAASGADMPWLGPWDATSIEAWLKRFEAVSAIG